MLQGFLPESKNVNTKKEKSNTEQKYGRKVEGKETTNNVILSLRLRHLKVLMKIVLLFVSGYALKIFCFTKR